MMSAGNTGGNSDDGGVPKTGGRQPCISDFFTRRSSRPKPDRATPPSGMGTETNEAQMKTANRREVLKSFPALSLVWARYSQYPPWPALVYYDEAAQSFYDNDADLIHVQFFDNPPTRAWVPLDHVQLLTRRSLSEPVSTSKSHRRLSRGLAQAKQQATKALNQSHFQRRKYIVAFKTQVEEELESDAEDGENEPPPKPIRKAPTASRSNDGQREASPNWPTDPVVASASEELSDYELIRLRNIEARKKMFAELQIGESKEQLSDSCRSPRTANPSRRGLVAQRDKPVAEDLPRRQSLRLRKIDADTGLQLLDKEPGIYGVPLQDEHPRKPIRELELADIVPKPEDSEKGSERKAHFLTTLSESGMKSVSPNNNHLLGSNYHEVSQSLSKLTITSDQVAKVVPDRIFSLALHPNEDKVLVAAGGKWGGVGLWDVNDTTSESHGVHLFMPHSRPVNCLTFDGHDASRLVSTSYDGTVRAFDLQAQRVSLLYGDEEDSVYTCYHKQIDAHSFVVALGNSGAVGLLDTRESTTQFSRKIPVFNQGAVKTVDVHPAKLSEMVCSSSRAECSIFDLRSLKKRTHGPVEPTLELTGHTKALSSAFYCPGSGAAIATVSYDNNVRLFKSWSSNPTISPYTSIKHNNQTGRWLTTFKAQWHPRKDDVFFIGCMDHPRQINAYSDQGMPYPSLKGEHLASICSIVVCHPTLNVIVGGNSSGRVHVFK